MCKNPECMEMPCPCVCGEWFDLNDGYKSLHSNRVICEECHRLEEKQKDLEDEIYYLEKAIDNRCVGKREGKKKLKELQLKLSKLTGNT